MTTNHDRQASEQLEQLSDLKRLKAENLALKVENEYLKKLDALVKKRARSKKSSSSPKN